MTVAVDVRARYSQARAEVLRQGLQLAAAPIGAYRTGSLLLRGSPTVAGFLAGWLSAEFPPHVVTGHALSGVAPLSIGRVATSWAAQRADRLLTAALQDSFGEQYRDSVCHPISDPPERRGGMLHAAAGHRRYAGKTSDISYGPDTRDNLLDIWRHRDIKVGDRAPVLLQIPGGAWTVNGRRPQGYPLMSRMAGLGWVCVSIDYSKSPRKSWPAHIIDVKRALAWVRENIADYGGDPDFITVTGGSAGGPFGPPVRLTPQRPAPPPRFGGCGTPCSSRGPLLRRLRPHRCRENARDDDAVPRAFRHEGALRRQARPLRIGLADFARPPRCAAIFRPARRERFGDPDGAGTGFLRRTSRRGSTHRGLRRAAQCSPCF